jgi:hypothetical protein
MCEPIRTATDLLAALRTDKDHERAMHETARGMTELIGFEGAVRQMKAWALKSGEELYGGPHQKEILLAWIRWHCGRVDYWAGCPSPSEQKDD